MVEFRLPDAMRTEDGKLNWAPVERMLASETAQVVVLRLHAALSKMGIPEPYPDGEQLLLMFAVTVGTLFAYYVILGRTHQNRRYKLQDDLLVAQQAVFELQEKLAELETEQADVSQRPAREIRVWMDGAFDMMHYGHMNAFRQGRALGTYLVVGVNSDKSIKTCKGTAPVMNDEERLAAVSACKWVDEVVPECPYVMNPEYLEWAIKTYKIDYVVHGDDPCIVDGKDVYEDAKRRGIYRSIPRTEGVSTTEIVGRMLHLSRDHHYRARPTMIDEGGNTGSVKETGERVSRIRKPKKRSGNFERRSQFLTTSRMLRIFSSGITDPRKGAKVVYIDGAWDMFHVGHVETLKAARALGDYLIVGVHNDNTVNKKRGSNYPLMNLNERVLSVLGCKYVDDVLIDAPYQVNRTMMKSLGVNLVVSGSVTDLTSVTDTADPDIENAYRIPKEKGKYKQIQSTSAVTVGEIVGRIISNEGVFQQKVNKKMKAEADYYKNRYASETEPDTETEAEMTEDESRR